MLEGETFFSRDEKNCFAAMAMEEKSVGFVPRRIVMREVIVRSLEWMRRTEELRPFTAEMSFEELVMVAGNIVVVEAVGSSTLLIDLSSTMYNLC
jgi:hypothetical protein